MVVYISKTVSSFRKFIEKNDEELIVVCFSAEWCGPCNQIAPDFVELSKTYKNVKFAKLMHGDFSGEYENPFMSYGISSFPTFLFIRHNKVVDKLVGADRFSLFDMIEANTE